MFTNTKAFGGFAVDDVPKAKKFYAETLGLRVSEEYGMLSLHIAGEWDRVGHSGLPQTGPHPGDVHYPQLPCGRHREGRR